MNGFLKVPWAAKNRWMLALGRLRGGKRAHEYWARGGRGGDKGVRFGWFAPWAGLARAVNLKD